MNEVLDFTIIEERNHQLRHLIRNINQLTFGTIITQELQESENALSVPRLSHSYNLLISQNPKDSAKVENQSWRATKHRTCQRYEATFSFYTI